MKNRIARVLASILFGVLTLSSTVRAQQAERAIKVDIPFDFVVGDEIFPPGCYSVVDVRACLVELARFQRPGVGHRIDPLRENRRANWIDRNCGLTAKAAGTCSLR